MVPPPVPVELAAPPQAPLVPVLGAGAVVVLVGTSVVVVVGAVVVVVAGSVVVVVGVVVVVVVAGSVVVVVVGAVVVVVGAVVVVVVVGAVVVVVVGAVVVVVVGAVDVVVVAGAVVVVVGGGPVHVGRVMALESKVTAALRASNRPETVAPVLAVADVRAKTLPTKVDAVPRVAELPTCQTTLQASAPPMSTTELPVPVMRVLADWKMKMALASPFASRMSVPFSARVVPAYTPGPRLCPARSAVMVPDAGRPAASLYAVVRSASA